MDKIRHKCFLSKMSDTTWSPSQSSVFCFSIRLRYIVLFYQISHMNT